MGQKLRMKTWDFLILPKAEGIAAAKAKGKHLGRPKAELPDNWSEVITAWKAGQITAVEAMRRTGLKRSTFYKMAG